MHDPLDASPVPTRPRGSTRGRLTAVVAVALGVVALAGCGAKSSAAASGDGPATTDTTAAAGNNQAYRDCLSQHGVSLPPRGNGGNGNGGNGGNSNGAGGDTNANANAGSGSATGGRGGFAGGPQSTDPAFQAAQQACQSLRPAANPQRQQQLDAYLSCLKDHGVTVPDQTATTDPNQPRTRIDQNDPTVIEANKICGVLRPTGGPGGGQGSTTTTVGSGQ